MVRLTAVVLVDTMSHFVNFHSRCPGDQTAIRLGIADIWTCQVTGEGLCLAKMKLWPYLIRLGQGGKLSELRSMQTPSYPPALPAHCSPEASCEPLLQYILLMMLGGKQCPICFHDDDALVNLITGSSEILVLSLEPLQGNLSSSSSSFRRGNDLDSLDRPLPLPGLFSIGTLKNYRSTKPPDATEAPLETGSMVEVNSQLNLIASLRSPCQTRLAFFSRSIRAC